MMSVDNDGQMIFGDFGGLKLADICLADQENPEKTSPKKPVPTGDRTRARCVTDAHAVAWPTAVDCRVESLNIMNIHSRLVLYFSDKLKSLALNSIIVHY